jgi:myo-inositol 2-dehydrogenase/D-chiro-inositol 1-dehydrogenase
MGSFHAGVLATLPDVKIVAVVDSRPEAAAAVAAETGAVALGGVDELQARTDVEAWLVATPTPTHPELVEAGLAAGVDVLCEKPVSLDPGEGRRLDEMASKFGRVLQVGLWRRSSPPWAAAHRLIREGAIGRPLMVRLSQWDADPPPPAFCGLSGGLAIDCGVHEFDLAEWLTGERVVEVAALGLPLVDEALAAVGDVDNLVALLALDGGAGATVDLSRNARYGDDVRTEILGSEGAIFVDLLPAGRTRLATRAVDRIVDGSVADDATAAGVAAQAAAFAARIRGSDIDVPTGANSDRAVVIGRAVQEAARTGTTVRL